MVHEAGFPLTPSGGTGRTAEGFPETTCVLSQNNPLYFIGGAALVLNCLSIAQANPVESLRNDILGRHCYFLLILAFLALLVF